MALKRYRFQAPSEQQLLALKPLVQQLDELLPEERDAIFRPLEEAAGGTLPGAGNET